MPSFEYTAIDRQGHSVQGQVQATTRDEAALNLTKTGLLVSRLAETQASTKPAVGPIAAPAPPKATPTRAPASSQAASPIRTRRGRDKDVYFLFSQLQSYAKAGLNPVETFTNVSNHCRRADYQEALRAAADAAKEGRPVSDVLQRYVDLFPGHVVGMVRAAEQGGFIPEAYELITDQAQSAHQFKRWFVWLAWVCVFSLGSLPLGAIFFAGIRQTFVHQVDKGENASFWQILMRESGGKFLWPWGPITLAIVLGIWFLRKYLLAPKHAIERHRMVMLIPGMRRRAQAESISTFGWTMSKLANVGLAPRVVWDLSADTVPNLFVGQQLKETGRRMGEQTKLSDALSMAPFVPEEYAPVVATGELTGDIPGQLMRASAIQADEFRAQDQMAKGRVGCWMLLAIVVASLMVYVLYSAMYLKPTVDDVLHWDQEP